MPLCNFPRQVRFICSVGFRIQNFPLILLFTPPSDCVEDVGLFLGRGLGLSDFLPIIMQQKFTAYKWLISLNLENGCKKDRLCNIILTLAMIH